MTRNALIDQIQAAVATAGAHPPVVALEDYFDGNDQEDSIAPNQIGSGRPSLADLYRRLQEISRRDDVQAVLVSVHDDWVEALNSPDVWPAGDCVHIYTSAPRSDTEAWIEGLSSDGLIDGWQRGRGTHPQAPAPIPPNRILTIVWD